MTFLNKATTNRLIKTSAIALLLAATSASAMVEQSSPVQHLRLVSSTIFTDENKLAHHDLIIDRAVMQSEKSTGKYLGNSLPFNLLKSDEHLEVITCAERRRVYF